MIKKRNLVLFFFILVSSLLYSATFFYPLFFFPAPIFFGVFILIIIKNPIQKTLQFSLLFGLCIFISAYYWLIEIIDYYGEEFIAPTSLLFFIIILLNLFIFTITAFVSKLITQLNIKSKYSNVITLSSLWTFEEYLRKEIMEGLPVMQISYSILETPYKIIFSYFGFTGANFYIFILVFLLCFLFAQRKANIIHIFILFFLCITPLFLKYSPKKESVRKINIRLIHGNVGFKEKNSRAKTYERIAHYAKISGYHPLPDIVLWHESAISFPLKEFIPTLKRKAQILSERGIEVLLGAYEHKQNKTYNVIVEGANPANIYRKRTLVPFGEYEYDLPLIDVEALTPQFDNQHLSEGKEQKLFELKGIKIFPSICFEIFDGELFVTDNQFDLIVNLGDLGIFQSNMLKYTVLRSAQIRALENSVPVAISTNKGISAFIDYKGTVQKYIKDHKTAFLDKEIEVGRGKTFFKKYGEKSLPFLFFIFLFPCFLVFCSKVKKTLFE